MAQKMEFPLLSHCKLTFSDNVFTQNGNLQKLLTNKLQFMITRLDPLVIEKKNPSLQDICKLVYAVGELLKVPETFEVHEVEDILFDGRREPEATGRKMKNIDLIQMQSVEAPEVEAPEVDKQFTEHEQDNNDNDGHMENNRGETTQAMHIGPGASSDLSLKQNDDPFSSQIYSKSSLLLDSLGTQNGETECIEEHTKQQDEQSLSSKILEIDFKDKTEIQTALEKDCSPLTLYEIPNDCKAIVVSESSTCNDTENDTRIVINKRDLKVLVYEANIVYLETDCIVNATNTRLQHSAGVARAIAGAAGPALTKECEEFINSGKSVPVADIFVSTGGSLRTGYVIHAVGPKWGSYDDKTKCFEDLRQTVLRCLVEAGRRGMTSIALPSISAAILKVPKEECARCYKEAVKHFDVFHNEEKCTLREIHFVDLDNAMVNYIRECFIDSWSSSCDLVNLQKDWKFAKQHLNSACKNETANYERTSGPENNSSDNSKTASSTSLTKTPTVAPTVGSSRKSGGSVTYHIGKITLVVDITPAFDQRSDFIITVGKPFDKLSGLQNFQIPSALERHKDMSYSKNAYQFVIVPKPGGKQSRLVCVVYPEPNDPDKVEKAFKNIEPAIQRSCQNRKSLVLTSSILYDVPSNTQQKGNNFSIDKKKVEKFAHCMYDFLSVGIRGTQENVHITVVGSKDAVLTIKKVLETCQKTNAAANQGTGSKAKSRGGRSKFDQDSYSQGNERMASSFLHNFWNSDGRDNHGAESGDKYMIGTSGYDPDRFSNSTKSSRTGYVGIIRTGNQPPGTMTVNKILDYADGYEDFPAWKIEYNFPSGVQQECHPNPGTKYKSVRRTAYLPANEDGYHVLMLLQLAFIRKLTFTIDNDDSITWNDIHHLIYLHGGVFGYPNPNYFSRIKTELANKRVELDNITKLEKQQLDYFRFQTIS